LDGKAKVKHSAIIPWGNETPISSISTPSHQTLILLMKNTDAAVDDHGNTRIQFVQTTIEGLLKKPSDIDLVKTVRKGDQIHVRRHFGRILCRESLMSDIHVIKTTRYITLLLMTRELRSREKGDDPNLSTSLSITLLMDT
jgi:hypothetical protein